MFRTFVSAHGHHIHIQLYIHSYTVVDGRKNTPDLHFSLRIKAKISEYASILTFQITLSFQVNFHLTLRQQRKKFQIFINSPHTLNFAIGLKYLKFPKKSEIFEKI